jgi:hypothetical protein
MNKNEIFLFQVEKNTKALYKSFLIMIEEIKDRHDTCMDKLKDSLPNESYLVDLVDPIDEDEMRRLRKKILDNGNDCIRNIFDSASSCGLVD